MASPITPAQVKALIPTGTDNICQQLLKFIQVMVLVYRYTAYKYDSAGNFTPAFRAELCSAPCFNVST